MPNDFALDIKKFAESFDDGVEQAVRGTTIKLWSAIIKGTPVDEGRARGNWFATGSQPSVKVNNDDDKSGESTVKAATTVVSTLKDYSVFTLTNNLPYIERLEYGYSDQAPAGMVRVNIARFNTLLEQEANKALPK